MRLSDTLGSSHIAINVCSKAFHRTSSSMSSSSVASEYFGYGGAHSLGEYPIQQNLMCCRVWEFCKVTWTHPSTHPTSFCWQCEHLYRLKLNQLAGSLPLNPILKIKIYQSKTAENPEQHTNLSPKERGHLEFECLWPEPTTTSAVSLVKSSATPLRSDKTIGMLQSPSVWLYLLPIFHQDVSDVQSSRKCCQKRETLSLQEYNWQGDLRLATKYCIFQPDHGRSSIFFLTLTVCWSSKSSFSAAVLNLKNFHQVIFLSHHTICLYKSSILQILETHLLPTSCVAQQYQS